MERSDNTKATVTNTGEVIGIAEGKVTITAKLTLDDSTVVTDEINLNVVVVPSITDVYEITEDKKYVIVRKPKTTVKDFKDNFNVDINITKDETDITDDSDTLASGYNVDAYGTNYKIVLSGDVNSDGKVNSKDALMTLYHTIKKVNLDDEKALAADVISDDKITSKDALKILYYTIKKIDDFE